MTGGASAHERLSAARSAQASWGVLPIAQRLPPLRALRHRLTRHMDELIALLGEELGKPPMDAVTGDIMVTLEQLLYNEQHAARLLRSRRIGKPPFFYTGARFMEHREPFGVVLVLAPWNYPVQLSLVPAATALAAGNAVLLKCSEQAPRTAALLAQVCVGAGFPQGLLQVSCEPAAEAATLLEAGPDLVFLTGSTESGRAVAQRAAAQLIPTVLELGGKDPALVFASAHLERAARGLAYGCFSNAGQVCVGTRRIYVEHPAYERFLQLFAAEVQALRIGTSPNSDLGPVRVPGVEARLRTQMKDALTHGARVLVGGAPGIPTVLVDVPPHAKLYAEETFGPLASVALFRGEREAIERANASPWALSASVWTADRAQGERVARALRSGSCAVNDVIRNIGNPSASFGGNHASGHGRYHGAEGLLTFTRTKTVMLTGQARAREVHWFPFRPRLLRLMRTVVRTRHGAGSLGRRLAALLRSGVMLTVFCAAIGASAQRPRDKTLQVKLPAHPQGSLAYLVFSSADGFPDTRNKALLHAFVPIADTNSSIQTIDAGPLPPGEYAVTVYLDANANGKLDKGFLGIPKEPVGASNNPKGRMGPPNYRECAFQHGASAQTIEITLVH